MITEILNVGKKVRKTSGKPFKSGLLMNTIKCIVPHPYKDGCLAYGFEEDDSFVEARICELENQES